MANLVKWFKDREKNVSNVAGATIRGASRTIDQINTADGGRTWQQRTPVKQGSVGHQLTHNAVSNVAGGIIKPVIQADNTLHLAARQGIEAARMATASITNNSQAGLAASQRADQNYSKFAKPDSGLFKQGTFFKNPEEAKLGDFKTTATRIGGGTLSAGATVIPVARGASVAYKGAARAVIPKLMAEGAAYNTALGTGSQLVNNGHVQKKQVLTDAAAGAVLGPVGYVGGKAVKASIPKIKAGVKATPKVAEQIDNKVFSTPDAQAIYEMNKQLQQKFDNTANVQARKRINQQIARNNEEIRKTKEGGYIGAGGGQTRPGDLPSKPKGQSLPKLPDNTNGNSASFKGSIAPDGVFITGKDKPVSGVLPFDRFQTDIGRSQQTVDRAGVNKWKKRIAAGERPSVIIDHNERVGADKVIDGHTRLKAYEELGVKDIPVIDRNGKILARSTQGSIANRSQSLGVASKRTQGRLIPPNLAPEPQIKSTLLTGRETGARINPPKTSQLGKQIQKPESAQELLSPSFDKTIPQNTLPVNGTTRVSNLSKAFRSTRSIIERQGVEGKQLGGMLQGARDTQEMYLADLQKQMPTVAKIARKGQNALVNKDFENFVDATQGIAPAKNAKIAQAVQEWQAVHPGIRDRAVSAGLEVGDLGPNYYPHFIDYDQIFRNKNMYNQSINHLVETGQAVDQADAIKKLSFAKDISRNRQFGNLEASRLIDLPFYDRSPNSFISYLNGSAKRIVNTETFGKGDEHALKLIADAGQKGFDTEAMKNAYDIAVGAKMYSPTTSKISSGIRKYVTTTRLGQGAITNMGQGVNTGVVTGHLRTLGAAVKQLDPKTKDFVSQTGVIADAVMNDLKTQAGYASFSQKVLGKAVNKITAPGFGIVEKTNRSIAAVAGRDYANSLARRGTEDTLRKLGVTGEIKNKKLTEAQQIQAARKVVEKTQFKVDPQDLPGWADSPGGKLVAQFRTFSYNQGKFISNEVLKPAAKGNVMPLGRLLAALPVGYGLYETKRFINRRPEEENPTKRGLAAFQNVGGAGLVFDLYNNLNPVGSKYIPSDRRTSMAVGAFGGPAVGVATQGVGAVSEAIQRKNSPEDPSRLEGKLAVANNGKDYTDLTSLARFGLQQIPAVGSPIKNTVLPFKKESNADAGKTGNTELDKLTLEKKNKSASLKASLSAEDYKLSQLSKADREKLVKSGSVTADKLKGLDNYVTSQKNKLGIEVSTTKPKPSTTKDAYQQALDKYQKDKSEGKISDIQDIPRQKELRKLELGSKYDKNVTDLYALSKAQINDYVNNSPDKDVLTRQLVDYDQQLLEAGLTSYLKFKTGLAPAAKRARSTGKKKGSSKAKAIPFSLIDKAYKTPSVGKVRQARISVSKPGSSHLKKVRKQIPKVPAKLTPLKTKSL